MDRIIPSEHKEEVAFNEWLFLNGIESWKINQETYTTSQKQKRDKKLEGVRSGISDRLVFLSSGQRKGKKACLVFIEMKRQRRRLKNGKLGKSPSKIMESQLEFLKMMNEVENVGGFLCYGAEEAKEIIKKILN